MTGSPSIRHPETDDGAAPSDAAFEWLAYFQTGADTEEGRAAFSLWLDRSPEHHEAYKHACAFFDDLALVPGVEEALIVPAADVHTLSVARLKRRKSWPIWSAAAMAASLLVAVVGFVSLRHVGQPPDRSVVAAESAPEPASYETRAGKTRTVSLPDGTVVILGGKTRIEVVMSVDRREVALIDGQAQFDVTPDKARPFLVSAGAAEVNVVGTVFDVRIGSDATTLSVLEGRVEVAGGSYTGSPLSARAVTAGQQVDILSGGRITPAKAFDPAQVTGWQRGRLYFDNVPLRELVTDVERYSSLSIRLGDPDVGDLRVSASFHVDQIDQVLEGLAAGFPIEVRRQDGAVILERRG